MIKPLQIGNVTLENNLILAPMAGVTDLPFRLLCKEQGAGLLCMEMVSAKAIFYRNKNTQSLLSIDPRENPVSLQLFGSDPVIMGEIAKQIERTNNKIFFLRSLCLLNRLFRIRLSLICISSKNMRTSVANTRSLYLYYNEHIFWCQYFLNKKSNKYLEYTFAFWEFLC